MKFAGGTVISIVFVGYLSWVIFRRIPGLLVPVVPGQGNGITFKGRTPHRTIEPWRWDHDVASKWHLSCTATKSWKLASVLFHVPNSATMEQCQLPGFGVCKIWRLYHVITLHTGFEHAMFRDDNWTIFSPSLLTANPSILFLGSSCDLRQACNPSPHPPPPPFSSNIRSDQQCTLQWCPVLATISDSRTLVLQHNYWHKCYKYFFHITWHWIWPINLVAW